MVNKRAWLRIFEAFLAIMLIAGAILFFYSKSSVKQDSSDYVYHLQTLVLNEIQANDTIRLALLKGRDELASELASRTIPANYAFEIKVCNIDDTNCKKSVYVNKQVYAIDRIIASNLSEYAPKKLRFFVWES